MEHNVRSTMNISNNCMIAFTGPYKPHTGRTNQCMNHAPAILAPLAITYGTHRCQLHGLLLPIFTGNAVSLYRVRCLSSSTADAADGHGACFSLTFWTVWRPLAWCIIRPCVHYTVGAWFIHWPERVWPVRGLYGPSFHCFAPFANASSSVFYPSHPQKKPQKHPHFTF